MDHSKQADVIRAYYRIRTVLGWLGLSLPVVLIVGGFFSKYAVEASISDYYHTLMRDAFVGTLTAIGLFLITYPGHSKERGEHVSDDVITTVAGIAAFGVAYFPNEPPMKANALGSITQQVFGYQLAAGVHYFCAVLFLSGLAAMCLRKFARTEKLARRRVYLACGWTIVAMTLLVIVASWFKIRGPVAPQAFVKDWGLVLWFEAIAIWAFAVAWLVKGRVEGQLIPPR